MMNAEALHELIKENPSTDNTPFRIVARSPDGMISGELMRQILVEKHKTLEESKVLDYYAYDGDSDIFYPIGTPAPGGIRIPPFDRPLVIHDPDFVDLSDQEDLL